MALHSDRYSRRPISQAISRLSVHFPKETLQSAIASSSKYFLGDKESDTMARSISAWLSDDETVAASTVGNRSSVRPMEKAWMKDRRKTVTASMMLPAGFRYDDMRAREPPITESTEKLARMPTDSSEAENYDPAPQVDDDNTEYPKGFKLFLIVLALCLAVFVMALDNSIIATAIPRITEEFNSLEDVGWYGSGYMLTGASLQLFFGKLYTFWSIKWIFLAVLAIFEVGSLICAIAQNSVTLILGRAIAGVGSAGIFAGALTILAFSVPLGKRPLYTGIIGGMFGISSVAGPLLGGTFTDTLSWRWCFYINLPIGAITIAVITIFFKDPVRDIPPAGWKTRIWQMDPYGTAIFTPAIICALLALHWGGSTYPWDDSRITSLIILTVVLLLLFIYIQYKMGDNATVPPRIFLKRTVWASALFEFFTGACFLESMYFLPIWFQAVKDASAINSGIRNIPMLFGVVLFSVIAGAVVTWWGYYTPFMICGAILMPIGYGLLSTLTPSSSAAAWIGYQIIAGAGVGIGMQQPLIAVQVVLDQADVPTGTAMVIFHQSLGGAFFVSAGQTVFNDRLAAAITKYAPTENVQAIMAAGAGGFRDMVGPEALPQIVKAFNEALNFTFYVAAATASMAIIGAVFVPWKSVKGKNVEMTAG